MKNTRMLAATATAAMVGGTMFLGIPAASAHNVDKTPPGHSKMDDERTAATAR